MNKKGLLIGTLIGIVISCIVVGILIFTGVINLKERCDIAVDFSQANQLEAELRFEVWKNKVREYWSKYYSRTYELEEIALDLLYQQEKKSAKTM